jgi:hypothetical protein
LLESDDKDTIKNAVKDALYFLDENENEDGRKKSYPEELKEVELWKMFAAQSFLLFL